MDRQTLSVPRRCCASIPHEQHEYSRVVFAFMLATPSMTGFPAGDRPAGNAPRLRAVDRVVVGGGVLHALRAGDQLGAARFLLGMGRPATGPAE